MTKSQHIDGVARSTLLDIYRTMVTIRECDARIQRWLSAGKLQFQYYPCWGQEAIPSALTSLMRDSDYMVTTYRCIHDVIAKGSPIKNVFAEIAGRETGLCKGKGGPMHLSDPGSGLMVTTGIVGAGTPIANGLALASKLRNTDQVVAVSFGDGATSIGATHEAMNLASLWRLPVIFLCQNNQYAEYTAYDEFTRSPSLAKRADGYAMPGIQVDGTDPVAMYHASKDAIERAKRGDGPTFIEAKAYRLQGHAFGSEEKHMNKEELATARQHPPVEKFRARLTDEGICTADELEAIDHNAQTEIDKAEAFAEQSGPVAKSELYTDVFENVTDIPGYTDGNQVQPKQIEVLKSSQSETMTYCQTINSTLDYAMEIDDSVFLLGEDIADPAGGVAKATFGLSTKYGRERVRPTPIAEQAIVGAAIGASMAGMRPVAEIMINDFLAVSMDQVANHAAKLRYMSGGRTNVPLTIRTMVAGNVGSFGAQHSQSLEAWLTHCPGIKVVVPGTPYDMKGLLLSCIFDDDPCVVMESMGLYFTNGSVPQEDYRIPLGVADIKREGSDVTIITYGWPLTVALAVAEDLTKEGISCEVLDLRSLVPLDKETILKSVSKTRRAMVLHGAVQFCGFGAEIAAMIHEQLHSELLCPVARIGAAYTPIPFAKELEQHHFPSEEQVKSRLMALIK